MKKSKKNDDEDFFYEAIMTHNYHDSENMRKRMDSVGIPYLHLQLRGFCYTHTALWDDAVIQKRMRAKIDALPPPVFSAAKFLELPFESGYWKNALRDGHAYEVFDEVVSEMTDAEKIELRRRVIAEVKL